MLHKFICVLLSVSMLLSGYAFGDSTGISTQIAKVNKPKKCLFPKSKKRAPDWVCNINEDNLAVTAVGSCTKSKAGIAFMEQMAATDARVHLADKLRLAVQQKIAGNEGGVVYDNDLISKISDEQLQGTKVLKSVYGPRGKLYVLMGIDEEGAQKLQEAIAADYLAQQRK
jgi:LPP20 lipoprotein